MSGPVNPLTRLTLSPPQSSPPDAPSIFFPLHGLLSGPLRRPPPKSRRKGGEIRADFGVLPAENR